MTKAQIFIPTYENDLAWLKCCLYSIHKYWQSPFQPVILAESPCKGKMPETWGAKVVYIDRWSDGRRDQVYLKFLADTFIDPEAEAILFMDSDCLFTTPSTTSDFCDSEGRPLVKMKSYDEILAQVLSETVRWAYNGYRHAIEQVLPGEAVLYEYMQCQPFLFYTETVRKTRELIEAATKMNLKSVMLAHHSAQFSEFNFFGEVAKRHFPDQYRFLLPEEWGAPRMRWYHSYTQSPDSERAEIDRILG